MTNKVAKLITFPPSSDCENARWMMLRYGLNFYEKAHAPPFFIIPLLMVGSNRLPTYVDKTQKLTIKGMPALFEYFDPLQEESKKLVPEAHKTEIMEAFDLYNKQMGGNTVKWAYSNLLPYKQIMINPLSLGTPWFERFITRHFYFITKSIFWKLIDPTPAKIDAALKSIQETFAGVDKKLADGRKYLIGDRFSLADMAFAVSGSPLVLPMGYGGDADQSGPIPTFDQWPAEQQAVIQEMRETPAGKFILRMYAEERYKLP